MAFSKSATDSPGSAAKRSLRAFRAMSPLRQTTPKAQIRPRAIDFQGLSLYNMYIIRQNSLSKYLNYLYNYLNHLNNYIKKFQ